MPHLLREKARTRVYNTLPVHGDEWPQSNLAFSLEEAPTFGRRSSREKARTRVYNTLAVHGDEWPQSNLAFSLEEAPTFGRRSSLDL
jgi:hypothetical protein